MQAGAAMSVDDGRPVSLAGDPAGFDDMGDGDLSTLCLKFAWLSSFAGDDPASAFHARLAACRAELVRRGRPDPLAEGHGDGGIAA